MENARIIPIPLINTQPIEKISISEELDVIDIFPTIQGEGPFSGHPAIFVRLAGCNLQCPNCDTVYTGPERRMMTAEEVMKEIFSKTKGHRLIVVTGGEPFRQGVALLKFVSVALKNFNIQFETNGTINPPQEILTPNIPLGPRGPVTFVISPKAKIAHGFRDSPHKDNQYIKYIVSEKSEIGPYGIPTKALDGPHRLDTVEELQYDGYRLSQIYLQPEETKFPIQNEYNTDLCVRLCQEQGYKLSIQIHKLIGVP